MKIIMSVLCLVVLMVCAALPTAVSAAVAADSGSAVSAVSSQDQSLDSASAEILTAQGSLSDESASSQPSEEGTSWVPTLIQICVILIGCELVILAVITFMKMKRKIK